MNSTKTILRNYLPHVAWVATSLALLNACGSTAFTSTPGSGTTISGVQTGSTTSGGNIYDLPDADSYVLQINGMEGAIPAQTFSVYTSHTLKVKVTPLNGPNLRLKGYQAFSFPYGCARLRVTVNGHTKTTGILRVDGVSQTATSVCKNAPTYTTLDFTNDETGNGPTAVLVDNAEYDNCRYTWPLQYGCQMSALFAAHEMAATVQIQNDSTWLDP
jgi:hypothetical protein